MFKELSLAHTEQMLVGPPPPPPSSSSSSSPSSSSGYQKIQTVLPPLNPQNESERSRARDWSESGAGASTDV